MIERVLCVTLFITLALLVIAYIALRGPTLLGLRARVDVAIKQSEYNPTEFVIFDRSPDPLTCDRLIIVQPIHWVLWARFGKLYVISTSGARSLICPSGSTPAILMERSNEFSETCLALTEEALIAQYSGNNLTQSRIPYDIPGTSARFTILSALNLLLKKKLISLTPAQYIPPTLRLNKERGAKERTGNVYDDDGDDDNIIIESEKSIADEENNGDDAVYNGDEVKKARKVLSRKKRSIHAAHLSDLVSATFGEDTKRQEQRRQHQNHIVDSLLHTSYSAHVAH